MIASSHICHNTGAPAFQLTMNRHTTALFLVTLLAFGSAGCDDNDLITNPGENQAPLITISTSATFGMAGITTFALEASVIEPNSDPFSVKWTFSDGTTINGYNAWRRFEEPGSYEVYATATDHRGLSGESPKVTLLVGTYSGNWSGEIDLTPCGGGTKPISASLTQSGSVVTGTVTLPEGLCASSTGWTATIGGSEPGQAFGGGSLRLHIVVPGVIDARLSGQMNATDTNSVTGTLEDESASGIPFTLTRQ